MPTKIITLYYQYLYIAAPGIIDFGFCKLFTLTYPNPDIPPGFKGVLELGK